MNRKSSLRAPLRSFFGVAAPSLPPCPDPTLILPLPSLFGLPAFGIISFFQLENPCIRSLKLGVGIKAFMKRKCGEKKLEWEKGGWRSKIDMKSGHGCLLERRYKNWELHCNIRSGSGRWGNVSWMARHFTRSHAPAVRPFPFHSHSREVTILTKDRNGMDKRWEKDIRPWFISGCAPCQPDCVKRALSSRM